MRNLTAYLGSSDCKRRVLAQLPSRESDVSYYRELGIVPAVPQLADAMAEVLGDDVQRQAHDAIEPNAETWQAGYRFLAELLGRERIEDDGRRRVFDRCVSVVGHAAEGETNEREAKQAAFLSDRAPAGEWTDRQAHAERILTYAAAHAARAAQRLDDLRREGSPGVGQEMAEAVRAAGYAARLRASTQTHDLDEIEARVAEWYGDARDVLIRAVRRAA